jgi:signal transduction histidine kinase
MITSAQLIVWGISAVLFLFTLAGLTIAALLVNRYHTPQGRYLGLMLAFAGLGTFAYSMELISPALWQKLDWVIVRYFSFTAFVIVVAWFVSFITFSPFRLLSWQNLLFSTTPFVFIYALVAYPTSRLIYNEVWLDQTGMIPMLAKTSGPLYWVLQLYVIGTLILQMYRLLRAMAQGDSLSRGQSALTITAISLIVVTHLMHLGGMELFGLINMNMFSYLPAALLILWGSKFYHLADVRPLARTLLFEQMRDGMLVLDKTGVVLDINPTAEGWLGLQRGKGFGLSIAKLSPEIAELAQELPGLDGSDTVLRFANVTVQARINTLLIQGGAVGGYLVLLQDISDRLEAERLREKEVGRISAWQERHRLARTLHDSVVQNLRGLSLLAGSAHQRLVQQRYDQLDIVLGHIFNGSRRAVDDLDDLIVEMQLETPGLGDFDLLVELRERINWMAEQRQLLIDMQSPPALTISAIAQREVFYILLEAINNTLQHSGAEQATVTLVEADDIFTATVSDNGCGFEQQPRQGGMGLRNMRERASAIGAALSIESQPGKGTQVCVNLPLANHE